MVKLMIFLLFMAAAGQAQLDGQFEEYIKGLRSEFDIEHVRVDSVDWTNVHIFDTRSKEEFETSHIKDAVWIGYEDFQLSSLDSVDKNQKIIVYCSVGYRSSIIGQRLIKSGFSNVKNLYGGIFAWVNQKRPVYQQKRLAREIHGYNRFWSRYINNSEIRIIY